jgi:hypothetical protein
MQKKYAGYLDIKENDIPKLILDFALEILNGKRPALW